MTEKQFYSLSLCRNVRQKGKTDQTCDVVTERHSGLKSDWTVLGRDMINYNKLYRI